ncbi:unnamed protein product [Euphydryas editha]|uniref:Gustatory receptor n=1 Tax=Euphydryas editha TaxID=104508 RepID=A0AAU9VB38_EUPED|nr:unnamed protein product [Euphydryas editha]
MPDHLRSNEVLYDNILNEDIQAIFFPFHLIQLFFLLPRCRISQNFLTFNSTIVEILSSLGLIIPCAIYAHKIKEKEAKKEWKRLLKIYKMIIETYDIYKKIFQVSVFSNWNIDEILMSLFIAKNIVINCFISFSCQGFYITVNKAILACIAVMVDRKNFDVKQICKNILRLNEVAFSKMEACRLFAIDSKLPLALLSSAVYYIIVEVQFAMLDK